MDKKISVKHILVVSALVCFLVLQIPALNIEKSHYQGYDNSTWSVIEDAEVATGTVQTYSPIDISPLVRTVVHSANAGLLQQLFLISSVLLLTARIKYPHFIRPPPVYHF